MTQPVSEPEEAAIEGMPSSLSASDAVDLLQVDSRQIRRSIAHLNALAYQQRTRYSHLLAAAIVPLYVTNFCTENCTYCGYRRAARQSRIRLSPQALSREVETLLLLGYRAIELVYASDPKLTSQMIAEHVRVVRRKMLALGGGVVGVNAPPLGVEGYRELRQAKVDFTVLWQETYSIEEYVRHHPEPRAKGTFMFRRDAPLRMLQAGIRNIGMGVLSGLAPWRDDWASLIRHEQELYDGFGIKPCILGIPRLNAASGALVQRTPFRPSDLELEYAVGVHTLFAPETLPWVNTRETWDLCTRLAAGGSLFTFDCSTSPGGYTHKGGSTEQFPTFSFPFNRHKSHIAALGLTPVFNWRLREGAGIESWVSQLDTIGII